VSEDQAETESAGTDPADAPKLDMSEALHMAGHEIEDLGLEGVPDTGPVIEDDDSDEFDFEHHAESDIATRGADGI
jgi:hypothetical protein